MGLFTAKLVEAAGAPGTDTDANGLLSWAELFRSAKERTEWLSGREGLRQEPELMSGQGALDARPLRAPRR
jgi:hypothetical protein